MADGQNDFDYNAPYPESYILYKNESFYIYYSPSNPGD